MAHLLASRHASCGESQAGIPWSCERHKAHAIQGIASISVGQEVRSPRGQCPMTQQLYDDHVTCVP
jgi:hypothetical protein